MLNQPKNCTIHLPKEAQYVLDKLQKNNFESFVVGGCVRDSLLKIQPDDWDVTSNATPEQIMDVFEDNTTIPTGLKHGTITVIVNHIPIEITTFRVDGNYQDHRRPESVRFTSSLREDLSRRDFTINAMAYNPDIGLVDYFNGRQDLENKTIRAVGDADTRFQEDALRILRCVRFASELDFSIENKTAKSMKKNRDLLDFITVERIQLELNRAVLGSGFKRVFLKHPEPLIQIIPELAPSLYFEQNTPYHIYDIYTHTLVAVNSAKKDLAIRIAVLLHDIGKPFCYTEDQDGIGHFKGHAAKSVSISRNILRRLKYSNEHRHRIIKFIEFHDARLPATPRVVKRWLNRLGERDFKDLLAVQRADAMAKSPDLGQAQIKDIEQLEKVMQKVLFEQQCFSIGQLAVDGHDLINLGIKKGPQIGFILNRLVDLVIEEKIENEKQELLTTALDLKEKDI